MIVRPPSHSWTRGLIGVALGGCLSQAVLAGCAVILHLRNDDPENVLSAVLPAILFGACCGFACGFPAGRHNIAWTALILFASCILIFSLASSFLPRSYDPPVEVIVLRYVALSLAMLIPTGLLVYHRMRGHCVEWDARERCGIEAAQTPIMQIDDDD